MLVSGVGKHVSVGALLVPYTNKTMFKKRITPGYLARNTYENAEETAIWMELHDFKNLILVTSNFHIPRSIAAFEQKMPHIRITPYPVFSKYLTVSDWWKNKKTASLLFGEYHKWLATLIGGFIHVK